MRRIRIVAGLAITVAFLLLLLRAVSPGEVWRSLAGVRPWWILAGLTVYAGALWARGARWRVVLGDAAPLSVMAACTLLVVGYALNNVLPLRAGEVARADLAYRRYGGDRFTVLGPIVVERALDGLVLAVALAATVALSGGGGALRALAVAMLVVFALVAASLVALSLSGARGTRLALAVLRVLPVRLRRPAEGIATRVLIGLTAVRGARAWSAAIALTTLSWTLEATMYWLVGRGFGLTLAPVRYIAVCAAANLAISVPSSAGGVGPFEFFAREAATRFGVDVARATAYALALHVLLLVSVAVPGLVLWARLLRRLRAPAGPPPTSARARGG